MAEDRALERAISSLKQAVREAPDLMPGVAQRISRFENFELKNDILYFTLERHPHIFGAQTLGEESTGYFTVEQRYSFNPSEKIMEFLGEECIDMVVDVDALVDEDLKGQFEWEDLDFYKDCTSEEEVRALAEKRAGELFEGVSEGKLQESPEVMMHRKTLAQAWQEFCDEFEELWCTGFVEHVIDKWTETKEEEDAGEE
jgi:hypothetical protein